MPVDYNRLGQRIKNYRSRAGLSQEQLCEKLNVTRKHLSLLEVGKGTPSIDSLVEIANALNISVDDLLVDSLNNPSATTDTELHIVLLDCNPLEEKILVKAVKELKAILSSFGI